MTSAHWRASDLGELPRRFGLIAAATVFSLGCTVNIEYQGIQTMLQANAPPLLDDKTVVLFDGKSWSQWHHVDGSPSLWKVQEDGSVLVGPENAVSAAEFGDFQLHVEFLCPVSEGKEGQARSNSGVYLHGRYEIQVLDSYGDAPADNLCGGIYKLAVPLVNASKPAGQWQSYDVVFRAPRFNDADEVIEKPRVTLLHNGVVIHNNVELPNVTGGGIDKTMVKTGPIMLQDHGDPVRYRNIWVRKF